MGLWWDTEVNVFKTCPRFKDFLTFLADGSNGRAYATVLRLSVVCCLWRM